MAVRIGTGHPREAIRGSVDDVKNKMLSGHPRPDTECSGPAYDMSHDMRFPTMWCVGPAKAMTSLRIRTD